MVPHGAARSGDSSGDNSVEIVALKPMSDYTITHTFIFTDEVLREFPDVGEISSPAPPTITPFLVPGDFVKLGEVKGPTFVVLTRLIDYVSAQELAVTYLLDFAPFEKKEQPILRLVNRARKGGA